MPDGFYYNILCCDRVTRGGGVAICIINVNYPYNLVSTFCSEDRTLECICCDVFPNSSRCLRFLLVYRAPYCSLDTLNLLINYLTRSCQIILILNLLS